LKHATLFAALKTAVAVNARRHASPHAKHPAVSPTSNVRIRSSKAT